MFTDDNLVRKRDEIISNLWLGDQPTIQNNYLDLLCKEGVTHILSVIEEKPFFLENSKFITKWINIDDDELLDIKKYFDECSNFIHSALNNNGKIYVHCRMGMSRSPSIIIAYLMKYNILNTRDFDNVFEYVKNKRSVILINDGFTEQLKQHGKELKELEESKK
jgi:protein-tyrosine phosphatase